MTLSNVMGDLLLATKRNSPKIKFLCGVAMFGVTLYSMHKSTLKAQDIIKKREEDLADIEEAIKGVENGEIEASDYTEKDVRSDRRIVNVQFGLRMGKNYALTATSAMITILLFHGAVADYRNLFVAVSAAHNALQMKYKDKMRFYKEKLGEEKFNEMENGFKADVTKKAQSTGLKRPEDREEERRRRFPYARWFDELHGSWTEDPELNKMWLLGKQNILDVRLQTKGHLFLNDMYEELGYPPTDAGRVMGIIRDNPDGSINHVDFGLFNIHDQAARWFVNGLEPIFLIDFNVDPEPITGRIGWAAY